jgi:hypothetical protein
MIQDLRVGKGVTPYSILLLLSFLTLKSDFISKVDNKLKDRCRIRGEAVTRAFP